jgi:hypothetical protein
MTLMARHGSHGPSELFRLQQENAQLRATIETAAEAIERGSTSAPIAEILRSALKSAEYGEKS